MRAGPSPGPRKEAGCPSALALEELRTGDLVSSGRERSLRAHLAGCDACRARFAAASSVVPPAPSHELRAAFSAIETSRRRVVGRSWRFAGAGLLGFAAAGAAAAFVLVARRPDEDEVRTKGGLALTLLVQRANGETAEVVGEGHLAPGEKMSFGVRSALSGELVVLGLDAAPSVSVYVPSDVPAGAARIEAGPSTLLPGSIVADERPGAERIIAVLCPSAARAPVAASAPHLDPVALRTQAAHALAEAHGDPARVGALAVSHDGRACAEATVLLHKTSKPEPRGP